ncbi:TetR family transcriptional regulator [Streptomyces sp. NPDC048172]|uniref:TetR family transcriptional regulator n=1 Tax=Streptomyces sp. NPDC048172 TaxID=3365505 RepID=UPI00371E0F17
MSARAPYGPTLTERRKAETEWEIARCAADLFAEHGAGGVTAEDIARAAGVSLRTFYRYFRTKEEAVTPLLTGGVRRWLKDLAAAPGELPVAEALERAVRRALTPEDEAEAEALHRTRGLLRAVPGDPGLRSVWHRVHATTEESLIPVLTALAREDADPLDVRLLAAAANSAMRISVETWAGAEDDDGDGPAETGVRCLRKLTAGLDVPRA